MLASHLLLASLSLVSVAFAANTNPQASAIINQLDKEAHTVYPIIDTIISNETISSTTLQPQISSIISAFQNAGAGLANTPVSDGSNTTSPTNDDISVTYGDVLSATASVLSGIQTSISGLSGVLAPLDPVIANVTTQLNTTVPGSTALVRILLLDARQFFQAKGFTQTLASLNFPTA